MKRIEFIAPVEAMRGNLSGKQDLLYAENDNPAYYGPVGFTNYARNYQPRFIGAKVAKSGLKYFTVRTKSANHLTAKSKKAMALLGGAGALYAALVKDKSSALYTGVYLQWTKLQELGMTKTFRQYVMDIFRQGLIAHVAQFVFSGPASPVNIDNPWGKFLGALNIQISNTVRVKFWTELVTNGIAFTVDGMKGVAINDGDGFEDWTGSSNFNVLSLTLDANQYLRFGSAAGAYILLNNEYVKGEDMAIANASYATTDESPE